MSQDPLDYQRLLQDALLDVVRRSLQIVAEQGLYGDHHFYIAFRTGDPGVVLAPQLREQYPEEMTIVLRTQFRDLFVDPQAFSIGLFFGGVRHDLTIPFAAISSFSDPAVGFQLAFEPNPAAADEAPDAESGPAAEEEASTAEPAADNVISFAGFRKRG